MKTEQETTKRNKRDWQGIRWLTQKALADYISVSFEYVHKNIERLDVEFDLGLTVGLDGRKRVDRAKVDRVHESNRLRGGEL